MHGFIEATETSIFGVNAPSSDAIETAILRALVNSGATPVGPRARITRRWGGTVSPRETRVVWLVNAPGPNTLAGLRLRLDLALRRLSSGWSPVVVSEVPATVADVAWWSDPLGASATSTRNTFDDPPAPEDARGPIGRSTPTVAVPPAPPAPAPPAPVTIHPPAPAPPAPVTIHPPAHPAAETSWAIPATTVVLATVAAAVYFYLRPRPNPRRRRP